MKIIDNLRRLLGMEDCGRMKEVRPALTNELPEQRIRDRAIVVKASVDRWASAPSGPMAPFPKVARAYEFYMRAPELFRHYCTPQEGMQQVMVAAGIDVPKNALNSPEAMIPFWERLEALLPDGPSEHELWAAKFCDA